MNATIGQFTGGAPLDIVLGVPRWRGASALLVCATGFFATPALSADGAGVLVRVPASVDPAHALPSAEPVFDAVVAKRLGRRAERRGAGAADLARWVRIEATSPAHASRIAGALEARPGYEAETEMDQGPAPPPGICRDLSGTGVTAFGPVPDDGTPSFESLQERERAALGMPDPSEPGSDGAGVSVTDVEYDWDESHEDLLPAITAGRPDAAHRPADYRDHGTAVLGLLGAGRIAEGVTGLAPGATIRPHAAYVSAPASGAPDLWNAIAAAAADLQAGDVLLVEQQSLVAGELRPIELGSDLTWAAIRSAYAAGVIVVEPAGNGGDDLTSLDFTRDHDADGSTPEVRSGAIMVGAGTPDGGATMLGSTPLGNYGARVDLQGPGEGVTTTGGGGELQGFPLGADRARRYTHCFDGTSSASAAVAGAIASLQGMAIARTGAPITDPDALRDALVLTSAPQVPPATVRIGPRPQIATAIEELTHTSGPTPEPTPDTVPTPGTIPTPESDPTQGPNPTPSPEATSTAAGSGGGASHPTSGGGGTSTAGPPDAPRVSGVAKVRVRPAVRGVRATWVRSRGRLVLRLHGLAPRAMARLAGRRLAVRKGRAVLARRAPGRMMLVVTAPGEGVNRYTTVRYTIQLPVRGRPRVTRLEVRPAVRGVRARWVAPAGRLVLRLRGLAPGARARLAGRRLEVSKGRATLARARVGRMSLVVSAPPRPGIRYSTIRYRVDLREVGGARVTKVVATSGR